jgi:hypothetical protein
VPAVVVWRRLRGPQLRLALGLEGLLRLEDEERGHMRVLPAAELGALVTKPAGGFRREAHLGAAPGNGGTIPPGPGSAGGSRSRPGAGGACRRAQGRLPSARSGRLKEKSGSGHEDLHPWTSGKVQAPIRFTMRLRSARFSA